MWVVRVLTSTTPIDRATLGLIEIRSHVWQDVVFVNVSGDAPAFEEAASELLERWAEFEKPSYFGGSESLFELEVSATGNWP